MAEQQGNSGTTLAEETVAAFKASLRGALLRPGDKGFPAGLHNYWKSSFLRSLSNEAIDTMIERFATVPSPTSSMAIEHISGAVSRVGDTDTAFNHRRSSYNFLIVGTWPNPADTNAHIR